MTRLSAAIIARDEEHHIGRCLASLHGVVEEIVVLVDDRTRDRTAAIAREHGARVHLLPWQGFPAQRNRALELCSGTWVLFIDADEQLTPELARELRMLRETPADDSAPAGYWIPRYNLFFGQRLRGGGWYPDHQLRLLRRDKARYEPQRLVHEFAQLNGEAARLEGHLVHHNIERVDELWRKQRAYAIFEAQTLYLNGERARRRNFVARPLRELHRRYLRLGGWRDGSLGLFLCGTMAACELLKFIHLKGLEAALAPQVALADPQPTPHSPQPELDLAIVVVSWNVRELLRRCLESAQRSLDGSGLRAQIVVVDNASHDGSAAMVRASFPEVTLVEAGANLGFSAGNNLALRHLQTQARHLMLLNPDTEVLADAIPHLVRHLDNHPDAVAAGPQLRFADGSIQPSRRRFPTAATFFWESTPLEQLWPDNPWARRYRCADQDESRIQEVDWLVGAALVVRASALQRAGLLDEGFFMYSEELEWQWRIRERAQAPAKIVYLPEAVVVHHEGRSSEQASLTKHRAFQRSKIRLARLRYGRALATALRCFLIAGYAAQLAVEATKWALGHRRQLRRERIALYWSLLREGL
jgi:N-acetylglucosaminyl-diphospho-decaprenol L-rhamnosyltransferase